MAKSRRPKETSEIARRKLTDAQAKLQSAQEKRARTVTRAEHKIEDVRRREAVRVDKATQVVERRATKVARAEASLVALQSKEQSKSSSKAASVAPASGSSSITAGSPEQAADVLEDAQIETIEREDDSAFVLPGTAAQDAVEAEVAGAGNGLNSYALRLLTTLRDTFPESGATYTDWLAAAGMAKRTFLSARTMLVDAGLVLRDGDGQGAHYRLAPAASQVLATR